MSSDDIVMLIGRVALGDRLAFRQLYDKTSAKLFGVCLRVLKNRSDAEEVLQETYAKIWSNAGTFQITGYSPMTWLITIARNQAIDRLRARRAEPVDLDSIAELADETENAKQARPHGEAALALARCLEKLPAERAEAVKAAYIEGYSYMELSRRYALPLNTVRTWLRRSLISLRDCLSS